MPSTDRAHMDAADSIRTAREELLAVFPEVESVTGFSGAYAATVMAKFAGDLQAVEVLLREGLTSSAAVVLRSAVFGSIRLRWLAEAKDDDDRDSRVVAFQLQSVKYEKFVFASASRSGEDQQKVDELESARAAEEAEILKWKSDTNTGSRLTDEVRIADRLNLGGVITLIGLLNHHVHLNRSSTDSTMRPGFADDGTIVIRAGEIDQLVPPIVSGSMVALGLAGESFARLVGDDEAADAIASTAREWVIRASRSKQG